MRDNELLHILIKAYRTINTGTPAMGFPFTVDELDFFLRISFRTAAKNIENNLPACNCKKCISLKSAQTFCAGYEMFVLQALCYHFCFNYTTLLKVKNLTIFDQGSVIIKQQQYSWSGKQTFDLLCYKQHFCKFYI